MLTIALMPSSTMASRDNNVAHIDRFFETRKSFAQKAPCACNGDPQTVGLNQRWVGFSRSLSALFARL